MTKRLLGLFLLLGCAATLALVLRPESQPAVAPSAPSELPILMYHKVSPDPRVGGLGLRVHPANFETQIKWLAAQGYKSVSLDLAVAWVQKKGILPPKPIVITFDDGYRDNLRWAAPILKKYGFRAAIFLVNDQIGLTNAWDEALGAPTNYLLNETEILNMAVDGFQFGSHTRTHRRLTDLSASEARKEISGSREALQKRLGIQMKYFCYPYGSTNRQVLELTRKAGYAAAFTTSQGTVHQGDNVYTLRRLRVTGYFNLNKFRNLIKRPE